MTSVGQVSFVTAACNCHVQKNFIRVEISFKDIECVSVLRQIPNFSGLANVKLDKNLQDFTNAMLESSFSLFPKIKIVFLGFLG